MKKKIKYLTAADWFGVFPGTEEEAKAEIKALKERRLKMSKEFERRQKKLFKNE